LNNSEICWQICKVLINHTIVWGVIRLECVLRAQTNYKQKLINILKFATFCSVFCVAVMSEFSDQNFLLIVLFIISLELLKLWSSNKTDLFKPILVQIIIVLNPIALLLYVMNCVQQKYVDFLIILNIKYLAYKSYVLFVMCIGKYC